MASVRVDCDIRSLEHKTTFSTTGEIILNELTFTDPNQDKHVLTWNSTLRYQKTGETVMDFTFDPTNQTTGFYQTIGQQLSFVIDTTSYNVNDGHIRITYTLLQDQEPINTTMISIDYYVIKEE